MLYTITSLAQGWHVVYSKELSLYHIIPNRSTGCLDKSPGRGYIRFREPGATVINMIYNLPSKLGGASNRRGAFIGDNMVLASCPWGPDTANGVGILTK